MWLCKDRPEPEITITHQRESVIKDRKCPIIKHQKLILGIVVGHNVKSQGAINYLGESEYVFNSRIARKIQEKLASKGKMCVIIKRPKNGGYKHECEHVAEVVSDLGLKITFHLHFNSASVRARGCEVLISDSQSKWDNVIGDHITDKLNERYGFKERGEDGLLVVEEGHSGYKMLEAVREVGCLPLIIEPCFGHYRNREAQLIFEREDAYVDILVEAAYKLY